MPDWNDFMNKALGLIVVIMDTESISLFKQQLWFSHTLIDLPSLALIYPLPGRDDTCSPVGGGPGAHHVHPVWVWTPIC